MKKLAALFALVAVATLSACAGNKDVCHIEGGERSQHEVCVKK